MGEVWDGGTDRLSRSFADMRDKKMTPVIAVKPTGQRKSYLIMVLHTGLLLKLAGGRAMATAGL